MNKRIKLGIAGTLAALATVIGAAVPAATVGGAAQVSAERSYCC